MSTELSRTKIASLHANTETFERRLASAQEIVARALAACDSWYVGFSTGKDSTVVLHLVHAQRANVPFLYGDEEWLLPESAAYLDRMAAAHPNLLHRIKSADTHALWFQTWQDDPDAIHSSNASGEYARARGWQGAFLGLRAEENGRRRVFLRTMGPLFRAQGDGLWYCNPLWNWTWRDVWAYLLTFKVDYNRAYDRLAAIGVPPERQRIGPLAAERAIGYGQLAILKRGWPDIFNKFAAKYPEARGYV